MSRYYDISFIPLIPIEVFRHARAIQLVRAAHFFFGSFAFGELAYLAHLYNQYLFARFFWASKRTEQNIEHG